MRTVKQPSKPATENPESLTFQVGDLLHYRYEYESEYSYGLIVNIRETYKRFQNAHVLNLAKQTIQWQLLPLAAIEFKVDKHHLMIFRDGELIYDSGQV